MGRGDRRRSLKKKRAKNRRKKKERLRRKIEAARAERNARG